MTLIPQHIVLQSPSNNDPLLDLNTQPNLDLQFATNKTLNDNVSGNNLITFSRGSIGTYVDSAGLIKNSVVNLALYSENLTQKSLLDATAPTETLLQCTAQAGSQTPYAALNPFTFPKASTEYTVYADFEKVSIRYATINFQLFSVNGLCVYDLDTGLVSNQPAGFTCSMTEVETGVYRCSATHTTGADTAGRISFGMSELSTIHRVSGPTTADQITIHRIQVEEGSAATTYIPTTNTIGGAPRFDHDPVTLQSLGLLIEEERTNLALYSEDISNAAWLINYSGSAITKTSNTTIAPDGTLTADTVTTDSAISNGRLQQQIFGLTIGQEYTASFYLKHLSGGTSFGMWSPPFAQEFYTATSSWQRFTYTFTAATTQDYVRFVQFTNSVASEFAVWGFQVEAGSFPTSYIPTTGATVIREADLATITGTNFSSWYEAVPQTWLVDYDTPYVLQSIHTPTLLNLNGLGYWDGPAVRVNNATGAFLYWDQPAPQTFVNSNTSLSSLAGRYALSLNAPAGVLTQAFGGVAVPETFTAKPTNAATGMYLGLANESSFKALNGHISRLTYYPYRLPDTTLQEITS